MNGKLSKAKISLIKSLSVKKYRQQNKLFIAEGSKIVSEILCSDMKIKYLVHTDKWVCPHTSTGIEIIEVDEAEIKKISNLKTSPSVIAIIEFDRRDIDIAAFNDKLTLAIDDIQDPGNLGTIIRICDWFGIENIICSQNSVDMYNPKVIQATMGSFLRVKVFYEDLEGFISKYKEVTGNTCYGSFLEGESIYGLNATDKGLIVLGNEGKGISGKIKGQIDKKILIPPFNPDRQHSESLNISIAAAIVCSEFRRKLI